MLLLHISDIHFRKSEIETAMDPNAYLRAELLRDAVERCTQLGSAPDAVIISGDIAFAGDAEEYHYATKWIEKLCTSCGAKMENVFVIPGNHDVVRHDAKRSIIQTLHRDIKASSAISLDALLRGHLMDEESSKLLYQSIQPYNLFAGQFFCDLLPPNRTIARRDLLLNDGSVLRLSGLNSTFVSSEADKKDDLFVDPAAFQICHEPGIEHLVACHHPYSWLRQGDRLKDHLAAVARIHLFGHEHTNRILPARDWVQIAASAAHPDRTEPGWEPGYNFIEVRVEGTGDQRSMHVNVHVRVWQQRPNQFRAKMDGDCSSFDQVIRLDPWSLPQEPNEQLTLEITAPAVDASPVEPSAGTGADPMDSLRDISILFFKLSMSQKSAIAGKLSLLEDEDVNQPDFERFRRVFIRARERGLIDKLDSEIKQILMTAH